VPPSALAARSASGRRSLLPGRGDAQVAETGYTALAEGQGVITGRLIVRPVKDLNHRAA
jgi:hypothetical protein